MQAEQILYGLKGNSVKLEYTANVEKWLREKSIHKILDLGKHQRGETTLIHKFASEEVVAYTHLKPVTDNTGREIITNHTVLFKYDSFFSDALNFIESYFKKFPDKMEEITDE